VVISTESVRRVAAVLRQGEVQAASAQLKVNLENRGWLIRAYYQIWTRLPYCREEMVGSGVYALSEEGRAAFGDFPELLAEDDFIRMSFPRERRRQVEDASFEIEAPTDFRALLKIRSRWARSNDQLAAQFPELPRGERRDYRGPLGELLKTPALWPAAGVYGFVVLATRVIGKLQNRFASNPKKWSRDLTARKYVGTRAQTVGAVQRSAEQPRPPPEPARTAEVRP
jgi:hypothetical protein